MSTQFRTAALRRSVAARVAVADLGGRIVAAAERTDALRRAGADAGAQAAEYAMLGGVSAAACTGLVAILKNRETLRTLVDAVIGTLTGVIEGWF